MKIVGIFANRLYAVKEKGQRKNELDRLLDIWNDRLFLFEFLESNIADLPAQIPLPKLVNLLVDSANEIDNILTELSTNDKLRLEDFFKPLDNHEYQAKSLSRQKGREQYLRIYAIKIGDNCFVITGGGIKFTQLMQDRVHTNKELIKINQCRDYLKGEGVFDTISFFELINEKQ